MRVISCAILAVLMAGAAAAHEPSLHKGHPTEGRVASVSENGLVLETEKGKMPVTVMETTKVERGDKPIARAEIRAGDHVSVLGTKLGTGELVAKEIVVHGPEHEGGAGDDGHHHGQ